MTTSTPEYLKKLRQATRDIHSSVEVFTDSDLLLGDSTTLSHYQQFLSAHYLLHRQVSHHSDVSIAQIQGSGLLDWPNCPRIKALELDLAEHGKGIDVRDYATLPQQSHGFALGLIYVCEGSCIGNQRVLASLSRQPSFQQWNCQQYLSTCKAGFAQRWKSLLYAMEQVATNSSGIDASGYVDIERGAIAGFELYKTYWTALDNIFPPLQRQRFG